jgi:Pyridoxamine 5'-phosphate oxidase
VSRSTELADVTARLAEYGSTAILVTVSSEAAPHVGTVQITVADGHLTARVGPRTREHIRNNPSVTLTWIRDNGDYQMIVDGVAIVVDTADADGLYETMIDVRQGILHRVAGRTGGPSCRALGTRATV